MTGPTLADSPAQLPVGNRRTEVLSLLRQADQPMSVAEVAEAMGLHVNTARFHLDGLVEDGLAERATESRETPGRPRILYSSEGPSLGPRSYELLAEMLTGFVSSLDDAGPATVGLGKAWGRHLIERAAPSERMDTAEAVARLDRMLDAVGFQPESHATESGVEVRLQRCPFREVAEKHTDVVCAIHLGLMQGALEELDAPVAATSLQPFVTPHLCIARLQPRASTT
jgi:predicted ArsR family transcriptional regulator